MLVDISFKASIFILGIELFKLFLAGPTPNKSESADCNLLGKAINFIAIRLFDDGVRFLFLLDAHV